MAEVIRGISVQIGAETTGLTAALSDVNKQSRNLQGELRSVERLLKLDPTNTTLLAQQQKLLADAVENSRQKLDRLRSVQEQVNQQFANGEINEAQYRAFQREVASAEQQLRRFEDRLDSTNQQSSSFIDSFREVGESIKSIGETIRGVGEKLTVGITAPIAGFAAIAVESTRELRKELAILKTNADGASVKIDDVNKAFETLNSVRDDIAANSETVNELLASGFDGDQLKNALEGVIGAGIKFKDTLNFEGIADGIQETFGVGEAAGSFLEVLERMGVNIDNFNAGLATSKENGTQTQYVLDTLAKLGLNDVYNAYTKNNQAMIENAKANYNLQLAMTNLGAILEPVVTKIVNGVTELVNRFNSLDEVTQKTALAIAGVAAVLGPLVVVIGGAVAAVGAISTGFSVLAPTIGALAAPIAIAVAAIAGIALAIKDLWETNEDFRDTVKEVWDDIKISAETIFNALKNFWKQWGDDILSILIPIWDTIKTAIATAVGIIGNLIAGFLNVITGDWSGAWDNIKNILNTAKDGIIAIVKGLGTTIGNAFSTIAAMAIDWGSNIIQGIINGITSKLAEAKAAALRVARSVKEAITDFFSIESPSKVTQELGRYIAEGLAKGIDEKTTDAEKSAQKLAEAVKGGISKVLSDLNKSFQFESASLDLQTGSISENITETEKLQVQLMELQLQQDQAARKVEALTAIYDVAKDKLSENSEVTQQYAFDLQMAQIEMQKTALATKKVESAIVSETQKTAQASKEQVKSLQNISDAIIDVDEKYRDDLARALDEYQNKVAEVNNNLIQQERQLTEQYEQEIENRARSLFDFVGLFDEVQTSDVTGEQLLGNLQGQVSTFEQWQKNIAELSQRGIDEGLIESLREMGPSAASEVAALLTLTDDQLQQYSDLWLEKTALAKEEATTQLENQRAEMAQKISEIRQAAKEQLELYRAEWEKKNAEIRKNADIELTKIEEKFQSIAEKSTTYGIQTVQGFMRGLESQFDNLREKMAEMAEIISGGVSTPLRIQSPSKLMADYGVNIVEGLIDGIKYAIPSLEGIISTMASIPSAGMAGATPTTNINSGGNTINITVQDGEDLLRTLQRMGVKF